MDTNNLNNEPQKPEEKDEGLSPRQKFIKEAKSWVLSLIAALVVVFLLYNFVFMLIRVDGTSMNDTLVNNERVFVTVADIKLHGPSRNDIVICHYPNRGRTIFVKRVKGMPGDQVERVGGETYVIYTDENGETVRESLGRAPGSYDDYEAYTLGENEYFVVGDNRNVSHDSRDWNDSDPSRDVGPITRNMILGKGRCVFWPLNRIRGIE